MLCRNGREAILSGLQWVETVSISFPHNFLFSKLIYLFFITLLGKKGPLIMKRYLLLTGARLTTK